MNTSGNSMKKIDTKVLFSALWIFLAVNYIYRDILTNMEPGTLQGYLAGNVGEITITQGFLLAGAMVMIISIAMVILSWVLNYKVNRWVTIVIGAFMILNIVTGGHGVYYALFETVEVACIFLIIWFTWKWKPAIEPSTG